MLLQSYNIFTNAEPIAYGKDATTVFSETTENQTIKK